MKQLKQLKEKWRFALSPTFLLILFFAGLPLNSWAYTMYYTYGGVKLEYYAEDESSKTCYVGYNSSATKTGILYGAVEIPGRIEYNGRTYTVNGIKTSAFSGQEEITSITLPSSIITIEDNAFFRCSKLASITIPDYVTTVGEYAFSKCTSLTSLKLPDGITSIGKSAFFDCTNLSNINLPKKLTSISATTFSLCKKLSFPMVIPDGVTSIGKNAFAFCENIPSFTLPDNLTTIDEEAFYGCKGLTSISLPNNLTTIGKSAFSFCSNLVCVIIPPKVTSVGAEAFSDLSSLKKAAYPKTISNPFSDGVVMSYDPTNASIEDGILYENNKTTVALALPTVSSSYTIPTTVKTIKVSAFEGCTNLSSITIPAAVTSIGDNAFKGCPITKLTFNATNCTTYGSQSAPVLDSSKLTSVSFGSSVTTIPDYICNGSAIMFVTLPASLTKIGTSSFQNCTKLTSLTIPEKVATIGNNAFKGSGITSLIYNATNCTTYGSQSAPVLDSSKLTSVYFGNSVTTIPDYICSGSGITSVTLPASLTKIGTSAFQNCTKLVVITIPEKVTTIGDNAFKGSGIAILNYNATNCTTYGSQSAPVFDSSKLSTVAFGSNVLSIPSYICSNSKITTLTLPEKVNKIGVEAFAGCTGIKNLTIPNSVISIGQKAFYGCSGLTTVFVPSTVTSMGSSAFYNCTGLVKSAYPNTVTNPFNYGVAIGYNPKTATIENGVIYEDSKTKLTYAPITFTGAINIPSTVKTINASAFEKCTGLTSVVIPSSVTSIGAKAFSGCSKIISVDYVTANPCVGQKNIFDTNVYSAATLYALNTAIYKYKENEPWKNFTKVVQKDASGNVVGNDPSTGEGMIYYKPMGTYAVVTGSDEKITNAFIKEYYVENGKSYPVTEVLTGAFKNRTALASVSFPESVTKIGAEAFYGCSKITSVEIPQAVTSIGDNAFYGCRIETIDFNAVNCAYCGSDAKPAFSNYVKFLNFGKGVARIPAFMLAAGSQMQNLTIPNSVLQVDPFAFSNSNLLKSVTFGAGLLSVSANAFPASLCKAYWLGNTPPQNFQLVKAMVDYAANDQYKYVQTANGPVSSGKDPIVYPFLSSKFEVGAIIYVPVSPSERTSDVIDCNYYGTSASVTVPNKVTNEGITLEVLNIGDYSFYNNLHITNTITTQNNGYVGASAFNSCKNAQYVVTKNNGELKGASFANCTTVKTATIDNNGHIGTSAFQNCTAMTKATASNNGDIGASGFYGDVKLTSMTISDKTRNIGESAFGNCSALPELTIPAAVINIGNLAFKGCASLAEFTFADEETTTDPVQLGYNIYNVYGGEGLLYGCPLVKLYIGRKLEYKALKEYGYSPFAWIRTLKDVEVADYEVKISDYEFYGCAGLLKLKIGNGVKPIGKWAFSGCSSLKYYSAGIGVVSIGEEAFSDCTSITEYYSYSKNPPVCGEQSLDDINKWICTLFIPANSTDLYKAAPQWKDFFKFEEMDVPVVAEIRLDHTTADIKIGETLQLKATILPGEAGDATLTWTSTNSAVAKVSDTGLVTGVGNGTAIITVGADGVSTSCIVTVSNQGAVNDITVDAPATVTVYTLQGVKLNINTVDELRSLAPGFYIVNGEKVYLK